MSARWSKRGHAPAPTSDELHTIQFGQRICRDVDDAEADAISAEEEVATAFGDALLFGVALVVLGASTPLVLLLIRVWWEWSS